MKRNIGLFIVFGAFFPALGMDQPKNIEQQGLSCESELIEQKDSSSQSTGSMEVKTFLEDSSFSVLKKEAPEETLRLMLKDLSGMDISPEEMKIFLNPNGFADLLDYFLDNKTAVEFRDKLCNLFNKATEPKDVCGESDDLLEAKDVNSTLNNRPLDFHGDLVDIIEPRRFIGEPGPNGDR